MSKRRGGGKSKLNFGPKFESSDAAKGYIEAMQKDALSVVQSGIYLLADPITFEPATKPLPVLVIHAGERFSDFLALRNYGLAGHEFTIWSQFTYCLSALKGEPSFAKFEVRFSGVVNINFSIFFDIYEHYQVLEIMSQTSEVGIIATKGGVMPKLEGKNIVPHLHACFEFTDESLPDVLKAMSDIWGKENKTNEAGTSQVGS